MRIIGLTGLKRCGKDTAASHIAYRCIDLDPIVVSFAQPIREAVASILGISVETLDAVKEEPIGWLDGITPRRMMQTLGTEWGRYMIHTDLWVQSLSRYINTLDNKLVIVSDVRFDNEAQAIRRLGGKVVRVDRGLPQCDDHISESSIADHFIDVTVQNFGSVFDFYAGLDAFLSENGFVE